MFDSDKNKITEIYTIIMLIVYSLLAIISINENYSYLLFNLFLIVLISSLNKLDEKIFNNKMGIFRFLLLIPVMYIMYSQVQEYISIFHSSNYDDFLIRIDTLLLGVNAADLFSNYYNQYLTEYLQITYFLFYFMPVLTGIELYKKNKLNFEYFTRVIIFTFYLSYLLYLFVPAIGPRFMIYNFSSIDLEIPGFLLTEIIRDFINVGGGIIVPSVDPSIQVNKDCMPSGHTMITIINIYLAMKYSSKIKYVHLILGISLIISTMYLRYHYFIDVVAGLILAYISLKIENRFFNYLNKMNRS